MKIVYLVAIPEGGGFWCPHSRCFDTRAKAEEELAADRKAGIGYTRIFELLVQ